MSDYEYSFGCLTWRNETYRDDVLILPDGAMTSWPREHKHHLKFSHLQELVALAPRHLIIGTGQIGAMEVSDQVLNELAEVGIDGRPMPTEQALAHLVDLRARGQSVAAALHLTC